MELEVEPLAERQKRWQACEHSSLFFGSGGYFIFCAKCGAEWSATHEGKWDHSRPNPALDTRVHRVIVNR